MKFIVFLSICGIALGKPHHLVYSPDGRSFSYSFQTPYLQTLIPSAQYYHGVPSVVVGPQVKYSLETPPVPVKYVEPANIQLSSDGFVLDTPEVAKAKAEHLAAVAKEQSKAGSSTTNDIEPIVVPEEEDSIEVKADPLAAPQQFQPANIQLSADGHVLDTPEVEKARAEHLARFAAEASRVFYYNPGTLYNVVGSGAALKSYQPADIRLSADGHVLDTPEVTQAKAEFFARYASEAARAASAPADEQNYDDIESGSNQDSVAVVATKQVEDPPADIQVSSDGFVLDTPEVSAAKIKHLAELAKVGSTEDDQSDSSPVVPATNPSYLAYTSPTIAYTSFIQPKYYGPEADIKVGPDGYLLDTPEVQQARAEHLQTRAGIMATQGTRYASGQYIADTPEVVAARAAHLKAHAEESSRVSSQAYSYGQLVYRTPVVSTAAPTYGYSIASHPYGLLQFRYAPTIGPLLTPDGQYLLDTPEVFAEKIKHFAAHAKARGY